MVFHIWNSYNDSRKSYKLDDIAIFEMNMYNVGWETYILASSLQRFERESLEVNHLMT